MANLNIIKKNKLIRAIYFKTKCSYMYISVLLTGYQHFLHNFLYYKFSTINRDTKFKKNGYELINLISANDWNKFSKDVSQSYLDSS